MAFVVEFDFKDLLEEVLVRESFKWKEEAVYR